MDALQICQTHELLISLGHRNPNDPKGRKIKYKIQNAAIIHNKLYTSNPIIYEKHTKKETGILVCPTIAVSLLVALYLNYISLQSYTKSVRMQIDNIKVI